MLAKIRIRFKELLEKRKCNEDWILAKADFVRARKFAIARKNAYTAALRNGQTPTKAISSESNGCLNLLPEMCAARASHCCEVIPERLTISENVIITEKVQKKLLASCLNGKRVLALAACNVVQKEIHAAREYEMLTTINLSQNRSQFVRLKDRIASLETILQNALYELRIKIKEAKKKIEKLMKESEVLSNKIPVSGKEQLNAQELAIYKRIDVEAERLNPSVANSKICIAAFTVRLFEALASYENARAVHSGLMTNKSEARVRTRIAHAHANKVISACSWMDRDELPQFIFNEDEDRAELDSAREPTIEELQRKIVKLEATGSDPQAVALLLDAKKAMEFKIEQAEFRSTDLGAEIMIAKLRVECESAECMLWAEWVESATDEGSLKPAQHPGSRLHDRVSRLGAANKKLQRAVAEAVKQADIQRRPVMPAYCSEGPKSLNHASELWNPCKAVADYAECESRLARPAERALALAGTARDGSLSLLSDDVKAEVEQLEKRLGEISRLSARFEARPAK